MLDIKTLETWLWDAACSIRGAVDAPKFKRLHLAAYFCKAHSDRGQRIGPHTHDKVCFKGNYEKKDKHFCSALQEKKSTGALSGRRLRLCSGGKTI